MDIKNNFSLLDEFSADEYAQGFIDQIEKERANLKPDKSMIEYREITVSFDELDEIPHGLFTVVRNGVRLETAYLPQPSSERLLVVLAGAVTRTKNGVQQLAKLPQLNMWSWSKKLNVNYLFIEDPMYYMFHEPQLLQGWYYGTETIDFRKYTADLICRIAEKECFRYSDIVIYGLSAGGTAALAVGKNIPGCSVISNNPTINFWNYRYTPEFESITGIDLEAASRPGERNDVLQNIETSYSKFLLMINGLSAADTGLHLKYVSERFHYECKPGLNAVADNFLVWVYAAPGAANPHTSVPRPSMMKFLLWICKQNWSDIPVEHLSEFFTMLGESYYEYYDLKRDSLFKESQLNKQSSLRDSPLIDKYIIGRFDIRHEGSVENNILFMDISDDQAEIIRPKWFPENAAGYVVNSAKGDISMQLKCVLDGKLTITLKGKLIKDTDGTHLPFYVDFLYFSVDDCVVLDQRTPVSHDNNIQYSKKVSDGDIVTIHARWKPHNVLK